MTSNNNRYGWQPRPQPQKPVNRFDSSRARRMVWLLRGLSAGNASPYFNLDQTPFQQRGRQ